MKSYFQLRGRGSVKWPFYNKSDHEGGRGQKYPKLWPRGLWMTPNNNVRILNFRNGSFYMRFSCWELNNYYIIYVSRHLLKIGLFLSNEKYVNWEPLTFGKCVLKNDLSLEMLTVKIVTYMRRIFKILTFVEVFFLYFISFGLISPIFLELWNTSKCVNLCQTTQVYILFFCANRKLLCFEHFYHFNWSKSISLIKYSHVFDF